MTATMPLVRLSFDHQSMQIQLASTTPISIPRAEATAIVAVRGFFSTGFQVVTPTGRLDRVAVWCGGNVMGDLARRGWPVSADRPKSIVRKMSHWPRWSELSGRSGGTAAPGN